MEWFTQLSGDTQTGVLIVGLFALSTICAAAVEVVKTVYGSKDEQ